MKKAIVLLAEGFEEGESLLTIVILRRAGISCVSSSIKDREVKGCNGISASYLHMTFFSLSVIFFSMSLYEIVDAIKVKTNANSIPITPANAP